MGSSPSPTNPSCSCIKQKKKKLVEDFCRKEVLRSEKQLFFFLHPEKNGGQFLQSLVHNTTCMPIIQAGSLESEDSAASGLCLALHFLLKLEIAIHLPGDEMCLGSHRSRKQQVDICSFPGLT